MDQRTITSRLRGDRDGVTALALPPAAIRGVGALLALAVAAAHVADQGGVTAFTAPDWLGWAYRLIEVGGVLVAGVLLWPRSGRLGWAAAALLSVGPFVGYLASRTVGVPGDPGDVGNWADWVGTLALIVEAALVTIGLGMVLGMSPARRALSVSGATPSPMLPSGWSRALFTTVTRAVGRVGADRRLAVASTRSAGLGERRSGVTPPPIPR
jgi:hypothetical protein